MLHLVSLLLFPIVVSAFADAIDLPSCSREWGSVSIQHFATGSSDFPAPTSVRFCWTTDALFVSFLASNERLFYNSYAKCNDDLYNDEVLEAFIARQASGTTSVPIHYLETELSPTNLSFTAYISNPSGHSPENTTYLACPSRLAQHTSHQHQSLHQWSASWRLAWQAIPDATTGVTSAAVPKIGDAVRANFFRIWAPHVTRRTDGAEPWHCTFDTCAYGAWQSTGGVTPNFHVPSAFGRFVLVE
eukprot:TRINITY_DN14804_c0_g1_i1.p1 TRINITY_DN14804_c0_g1~~TRINITY_DN14804_c0_g1_i1.p1  ORF type:complete len:266 (-),score=5.03 TRINITY_DN14804_c0_g1_i1:305-1039(-)